MPTIQPLDNQSYWRNLATQFRPRYKLHSEEVWYPMHVEDLLYNCMSLVKVTGSTVKTLFNAWLTPDMLLYTQTGAQQVANYVKQLGWAVPDAATIADLQPKASPNPHYAYLTGNGSYRLKYRPDGNFTPPFGYIESQNFSPANATWYHNGAPNWPGEWLPVAGWSRQQFAAYIASGGSACATQEPTIVCWAQQHTVAGVQYVDLIYTCYFGYNGSISLVPGQGEHFNDVVTNVVRLNANDLTTPVRYMYAQHGGCAWYTPDQVQVSNNQVLVYLARQSHESYPVAGRFSRLFGLADDITDDAGVTWTPAAEYVYRPQGIDSNGVDTDALRRQISPTAPNSVVLVPTSAQANLWQYVSYSYIQNGGDGLNAALISQGGALFSSSKWWPSEGPAGTSPPLANKAADPSGPGVPDSFYNNVAVYLGPDPLPGATSALQAPAPGTPVTLRGAGPSALAKIARPEARELAAMPTRDPSLKAVLGDGAAYLDWTSSVGQNLLGGLTAYAIPYLATQLPATVTIPSPWSLNLGLGTLELSAIDISGLRNLVINSLTASGPQTLTLAATITQISGQGSLTFDPLIGPRFAAATAQLTAGLTVRVNVNTRVPLATSGSGQWYVPYIGPAPYSFGLCPNSFAQTSTVSLSWVDGNGLGINVNNLTLNLSGLVPVLFGSLSFIVEMLTSFLRQQLVTLAVPPLVGAINGVLSDVYQGKTRVD
jgi:hypothetical protein